jgi:hypothetical protein
LITAHGYYSNNQERKSITGSEVCLGENIKLTIKSYRPYRALLGVYGFQALEIKLLIFHDKFQSPN